MEKNCLRYIQLFCEFKDPDTTLLRTFATSWFAYKHGGPWLNRNRRPYWLNKPHPIRQRNLLESCHFVSQCAMPLIGRSDDKEALKIDHAIPLKVLRNELHSLNNPTVEELGEFLTEHYRLGVITSAEHQRLGQQGFGASMPEGAPLDGAARYEAANILLYAAE